MRCAIPVSLAWMAVSLGWFSFELSSTENSKVHRILQRPQQEAGARALNRIAGRLAGASRKEIEARGLADVAPGC